MALEVDPRRSLAPIALAAVCLAALLVPFRVFLPRFSTHVIGDHGDALLQHLHCAWQWQALVDGRFGDLLDLPTMAPYSTGFAFGEPLLGVTLPLAPLPMLGASTAATFNTAIVLSFLLLGLGVFFWVRDWFGSSAAGLFAAVLVVFVPWRLDYLANLNNLTFHYALFGMWLLHRWLQAPRLATLLGAALLFHLQLVTAAQGALTAIYLSCIWLLVVWLGSGARFDRTRLVQGAVAAALFAMLSAPWLGFFEEAFASTPGLMRTAEMASYSATLPEMARQSGVFGPLGVAAVVGVAVLVVAMRRGDLPRSTGVELLGLGVGAVALFVVGRGPYVGPESAPTALPGYYAMRFLPLLDSLRAPIRLTSMTPVVLAIVAGGGFAVIERHALARLPRWERARWAVPLLLALLWPALPAGMAPPIAQRPADRALAEALATLPDTSVILSLPMNPEPSGAAVDERVQIHRRKQIGGFASIIAEPFRHARLSLGQWPDDGTETAQVLGATHVVVPDRWLARRAGDIDARGYQVVGQVAGRAVLSVPAPKPTETPAYRVDVPPVAAADHWLTLSITPDVPVFDPQGHRSLSARWHGRDGDVEVQAHAFVAGVLGPGRPIRVHVPTPNRLGRHELVIDDPGRTSIAATVDLRRVATSLDAPVRDVSVSLAEGFSLPERIRAGEPFRVEVEISLGSQAPILLATSRCTLPERCGEVTLGYQLRGGGMAASGVAPARTTLSRDLAPGDHRRETWYLRAPPRPGRFDLFVRLGARGSDAHTPWIRVARDLELSVEW